MRDFIQKYKSTFIFAGLLLLCFMVYFFGIGNYPLLDVDDTRYVSMARDMFNTKNFLTLYLNGEYFFEKPPLYFWSECLSFELFGKVSEFSARFAVAFYALIVTVLVFFVGKKVVSRRFGIVSAIILATMIEFVILAKYAILDIVLASLVGCSVLFGFLTQFVKENHQKYFWWLFYMCSGLAVMAKGIPGFVIPFGTMFFVTIFNKTFKKIFRPSFMIPGVIIFLLIVIPWHVIMLKMHNPLFFDEYVVKHHLDRFFSSNEVGREQPFYFYILTLLWGAMPYTLSLLAVGLAKILKWEKIDFSNMTNERKFLWFNIIAFVFTLTFFSMSSTKLVTYILPIYTFLAYIIGLIWKEYIYDNKYVKPINISSYIIGGIFVFVSIAAIFMKYYLPEQIYLDIMDMQWFNVILLFVTGLALILFTAKKLKPPVLGTFVMFVAVMSAFGTRIYYNFNFKFGQNDLMSFSRQEKELGHKLYVINNPRKYSVLYYDGNVKYITLHRDTPLLEKTDAIYNQESRAIIKNKDVNNLLKDYNIEFLEKGRKYSMLRFNNEKHN